MEQNKLYVGNLAYDLTIEELNEAFAKFGGTITDSVIISDRETGRSRGFGFVTFSSDEEAQEALQLNDVELNGRKLNVRIANADGRRGGGSTRRHGSSRSYQD